MHDPILAIDQGTTSTRSLLFDETGRVLATRQQELPQSYPHDGWVEQDPEHIWRSTVETARAVVEYGRPAAIGIANQRETILLWDRDTGIPLHPAIVWQDRRTAPVCTRLRAEGAEPLVTARTGLLLDPYFSATKLAWLLDHVPGARARATQGHLAAGTVDTFLLWRLTEGRVHATDATNASRTLLFDIHRQCWDEDLLRLFEIPAQLLPEVRDNATPFGATTLFGTPIPITGMAGDQQAALIGQSCLSPGMMKATYGTGCFALVHTGFDAIPSAHRMLTTTAARLDGRPTYAIEGAIFTAGAAVKWLRDGLGLIASAAETEALAASLPDDHGVTLVPAFVGLGAPHWRPDTRALIAGLTFDSTRTHLVRAALESVAYQTLDLATAMQADTGQPTGVLRIDGGMTANTWLCQFIADILDAPVERPAVLETTAWGAASLAALGAGLIPGLNAISWQADRRFEPRMAGETRKRLIIGWQQALERALFTPRPFQGGAGDR